MNNKALKRIIALIFIMFFIIVVILNVITPSKEFSEQENRMLEQKPKFSMKSLLKGDFTKKYEKYISDQFVFRDFWVELKSGCDKLMGKKESNDVYLGKDNFLLEKFKKPEDKNINERINAVNKFNDVSSNLKKYVMIAPTSVEINNDKLPKYVIEPSQKDALTKFKSGLNQDITFINVYDKLKSKSDEYIYYKTDHHWTTDGAYYAYEELSKYMGFTAIPKSKFEKEKVTNEFLGSLYSKGNFRNIDADEINIYRYKSREDQNIKVEYSLEEKVSDSLYEMKNLEKKDKYTIFQDGNHPLVKIRTNSDSDRKLLILKDSYANSFVPFLIEHFSEIYMVDLRYYKEDLSKIVEENDISEMLMLYNANTYFQDMSVKNIKY